MDPFMGDTVDKPLSGRCPVCFSDILGVLVMDKKVFDFNKVDLGKGK
jgi:hypothetical protein